MSKNLPAKMEEKSSTAIVPAEHKGFEIVSGGVEVAVDPALLSMLDESDFGGFEQAAVRLPFVSIRQKDLKDETGKRTVRNAGGFRMVDKSGIEIDDIDGDQGLIVTVFADRKTRVFFQSLESKQPECRSLDNMTGIGTPGGECVKCSLSQWNNNALKPEERRPRCASQYNLICWGWAENSPYVLNVGRSGLAPWDDFKRQLGRNKITIQEKPRIEVSAVPSLVVLKVTTKYLTDPAPYYVPVFTKIDVVSAELYAIIREARKASQEMFVKTLDTTHVDDERGSADSPSASLNPANEIPQAGYDVPPNRPNKDFQDGGTVPYTNQFDM